MEARGMMKRLRGAAASALVWGAGWAAGSFLVFQVLLALGVLPENMFWADGLLVAARFAFVGGLAGGAFSLFSGLLYRGRRLSEISWRRFAAAGGLLAGVGVPAFLLTMGRLSGDAVPAGFVWRTPSS